MKNPQGILPRLPLTMVRAPVVYVGVCTFTRASWKSCPPHSTVLTYLIMELSFFIRINILQNRYGNGYCSLSLIDNYVQDGLEQVN